MNKKEKCKKQLGIDFGTAQNRLYKIIFFELVRGANLDVCYRCEKPIETVRQLSIEHVKDWRGEPNAKEVFFDLKNITFSHLSCNSKNARQPLKGKLKHPSASAYRKGCRCDACKEIHKIRAREYRRNRI